MTTIMLHRVKTLELTQTVSSEISSGTYWRRKLIVTDDKGNKTEITLFADSEEPMEIKEITL
jgi:hypothetical protein